MFSLEEARKRLYALTPEEVSDMIDQALEESELYQYTSSDIKFTPWNTPDDSSYSHLVYEKIEASSLGFTEYLEDESYYSMYLPLVG